MAPPKVLQSLKLLAVAQMAVPATGIEELGGAAEEEASCLLSFA